MIAFRWDQCSAGLYPECGCHYTNDDDGIHFCPTHQAADELLGACKMLLSLVKEGEFPREQFLARKVIAKAEGLDEIAAYDDAARRGKR